MIKNMECYPLNEILIETLVIEIPHDGADTEECLKYSVGCEQTFQQNTFFVPYPGKSSLINMENNLQEPFLYSMKNIECSPPSPISNNILVNDISQDGDGREELVNEISQDGAGSEEFQKNNVGCEHSSQANKFYKPYPRSSSPINVENNLHYNALQSMENIECTPLGPISDNTLVNDNPHDCADREDLVSDVPQDCAGSEDLVNDIQQDGAGSEDLQTYNVGCEYPSRANTFNIPYFGLSSHINVKNNLQEPFMQLNFIKKNTGTNRRSNICSNSNCSIEVATTWRKINGEIVCNACGLYYKRTSRHRPTTMRKDKIQKRSRNKKKIEHIETNTEK